MLKQNEIYLGDSFKLIEEIPDHSVDLILEDMPYNTTDCKWDVKIDLEKYWESRLRILKPKGKIILTSQNPFTSRLILSNIGMFGHEIIWEKTQALGFFNAKELPLRAHENIILFYNKLGTYNPIFTVGTPYTKVHRNELKTNIYHGRIRDSVKINEGIRYPRSVVKIPNPNRHSLHPTQKPVALFEYLIKTYTNEGDLVFDGFAGSGTTAVASHNLNRNFIVIEKEQEYFDLATKRLSGIRHIAQEPPVIESPT